MDTIEMIPLLNYKVRFRRLSWREEFALKPGKKQDPVLHFLAHAMVEVSGMEPIKDPAAALKLLQALPPAIRSRVWLIYRGGMPESRHPHLCEVLRKRGLPLRAQYTTADTAGIFGCDIRSIQERIHSRKWKARNLPKRGRFLSCDLEHFLQMPLLPETGKPGDRQ